MSDPRFLLFIAGSRSVKSKKAIQNLKTILGNKDYDLTVIDILKNPHVAESVGIIATPMLFKSSPQPIRRFIGDLSNLEHDFFI